MSGPAAIIGVSLLAADESYRPAYLAGLGVLYLVAVTVTTHGRGWSIARAAGATLGAAITALGLGFMIGDGAATSTLLLLAIVGIGSVLLAAMSQAIEFTTQEAAGTPSTVALIEARIAALTVPWISIVVSSIADHLELVSFRPAWTVAFTAAVLGVAFAALSKLSMTVRLLHLAAALSTMTVAMIAVLDGPVLLTVLLGQTAIAGFLAKRFDAVDMWLLTGVLGSFVALITAAYLLVGTFDQGLSVGDSLAVLLVVIASGVLAKNLRNRPKLADAWVAPWLLSMAWASATFRDVAQGQMIVTLIWAAIGAGLVFVAARMGERTAITAGLTTLAVTAGKLIFVDLVAVDVLWRAGLFFAVGMLFLRLAFVLPKLIETEPTGEAAGGTPPASVPPAPAPPAPTPPSASPAEGFPVG